MNIEAMLVGAAIGAILVGTAGGIYALAIGIRQLADKDLFVTFVEEGTAKAFVLNGQFQKMEMSLKDHCFVSDLNENLRNSPEFPQYLADHLPGLSEEVDERRRQAQELNHPWLILKPEIRDLPKPIDSPAHSLFGGIKWVGIYPFSQIHTYDFTWSRIKQLKEGERSPEQIAQTKMEDQLKIYVKTSDKNLDYILIRDYTYAGIVKGAETKGGIPVDILFVLTLQIENPYKALFGVNDWLNTILDQMGARLRDHVGKYTYELIIGKDFDHNELLKDLANRLFIIRKEYGAYIKLVQTMSIEPGSELSTTFRDATTRKQIAEIDAEVVRIGATAERERLEKEYEMIGRFPHGPAIKTAEAIRDSKLTTLVTGSANVLPSIDVTGRSSPATPPSNNTNGDQR